MVDRDSCHLWLAVLFLYITAGIYSWAFLKIFNIFFIFLVSGFKTVVIVNRRKANRRQPSATCLFVCVCVCVCGCVWVCVGVCVCVCVWKERTGSMKQKFLFGWTVLLQANNQQILNWTHECVFMIWRHNSLLSSHFYFSNETNMKSVN